MWNKIQRIYVGTNQVYPVWRYSYDFRNKTVSQIISDGWVTWAWTPAINSIWYASANSNIARSSKTLTNSLADAKKITLDLILVWGSAGATAVRLFGNWRTYATWIYIDTSTTQLQVAWDVTSKTVLSSWTYTVKIVIDITNSTATFSITWQSDTVINLTNTQINNIKNQITNIEAQAASSNSGVTSVSLTVEY